MKKIILLFMMLFLTIGVMQSQIKIGGNAAPEKGAILDLNGTVQGGLLLPNVNITDTALIPATFTDALVQNADNAPALAGMIVWNTSTVTGPGVFMWDGAKWSLLQDGVVSDPCGIPLTQSNPAAATIASGSTHTFSLAAASGGSGTITYQWEQSSNNSTWANATGTSTNAAYTTPALTSNMYYRRQATAATCGGSITSAAALVKVAPSGSVPVGSYFWATKNLTGSGARGGTFVANIYDPGMFYQFNRSQGWASSGTVTGWNSTGDAAATSWVVGNDPCPTGFRVPTTAQLTNLISQPNVWVASGNSVTGLGGQSGRIYGPDASTTAFNPETQIFLPAQGARGSVAGQISGANEYGRYFGGEKSGSYFACLWFSSSVNSVEANAASVGTPLRCVSE